MKPKEVATVKAVRDQMKGHAKALVSGANQPKMISAVRTVKNMPVMKKGLSKSVTSTGIC